MPNAHVYDHTTQTTIQDTNRRENKSAARARQVHYAYGLRWQVERKCGPQLLEYEINMHAASRDERFAIVFVFAKNYHRWTLSSMFYDYALACLGSGLSGSNPHDTGN